MESDRDRSVEVVRSCAVLSGLGSRALRGDLCCGVVHLFHPPLSYAFSWVIDDFFGVIDEAGPSLGIRILSCASR